MVTNTTNSLYNIQFPCQLVCSLFFSTLLLSSKKTTELKFCSEKSYYKSYRKNEPLSGNSAHGGRCSHPLPSLLHQRGYFSWRFYEVSFGNVLGITDFLPGSRNRTTNHRRSCNAGICNARGASTSLTTFTYLGATYFREERCVLLKMCL